MRRSFTSSKALAAACPLFASMMTQQQRNVFVYAQQVPALENNAKHLKYKSNVWIEDRDAYWYEKVTELKSVNETSSEAVVPRLVEYYNIDCLAEKEQLMAELPPVKDATKHYSFSSKKPFSKNVAKKFQAATEAHGYTSPYWIPASVARNKYTVVPRARPTHVIIPSSGKFYNADQFANPAAITKAPVSAYKRIAYGRELAEALRNDMLEKKYPTGLYFTAGQLELFNLADKLKADAEPLEIAMSNSSRAMNNSNNDNNANDRKLFNIAEVENGDDFMKSLVRFPVDEETYLISGKPLRDEKALAALKQKGFKQKYWISRSDVEFRGYKLKDNAEGVAVVTEPKYNNAEPKMLKFFSVHQLENPDMGFKVAGTKEIKP